MFKNQVLKIKLGNNPTSSATTYQLLPNVYSAVKITVWIILAFFGVGIAGVLASIKSFMRLRKVPSEELPNENQDSMKEVVAISLLYISRNLKNLFKVGVEVSFVFIPFLLLFIFTDLAGSTLPSGGGFISAENYQAFLNIVFPWLAMGILPCWFLTSIISQSLVDKEPLHRVNLNFKRKAKSLSALVFLIIVALFLFMGLQQLPWLTQAYPVPDAVQELEVGRFGIASIVYFFGLTLFLTTILALYKQLLRVTVEKTFADRSLEVQSVSRLKSYASFWISITLGFLVALGLAVILGGATCVLLFAGSTLFRYLLWTSGLLVSLGYLLATLVVFFTASLIITFSSIVIAVFASFSVSVSQESNFEIDVEPQT